MHLFGVFTKMLSGVSPEAIFKALDLQCKMLLADLERDRGPMSDEVFSIFSFTQFLSAFQSGKTIQCARPLPPDHIEFFKETIVRMIAAGQLPASAMDEFDSVFNAGV